MKELTRRLRRWRMELLAAIGAEGGLRFASALAAYLLAALLLDRALVLSQPARWALFALGAAAFCAGAYAYLLRPLKGMKAAALLREVSLRYPHLAAYLRSAWELGGLGGPGNTSPDLREEHLRRTDRLLKELPEEKAFPARPSRTASRRLTAVAAAWGLGLPWVGTAPAGFQRVLAPWKDARLEALLEVSPGDGRAPWGEAVEVRARWRTAAGGSEAPELWLRTERGAWARAAWDAEGPYSYRIEALTGELEYRISALGVRSRVYRLTPVPSPRLSDLTALVRLPGADASAREVRLEGVGEIAALRGSWVTVRGRAERPLKEAALELSPLGSLVPMRGSGGRWEGGFPLNDNGTLRILVTAADGSRDPRPVAYALRALEDKPPSARILSPAFDLEISPRERLTLAFEASDDYGLASLALLYRVEGSGERVVPLKAFPKGVERHLGDHAWDLSGLPLGRRVEMRIRATDNARPRPQTAVSDPVVLRLTDFESAHAETERRWQGAEQALARLADREGESARRLREAAEAGLPPERMGLSELDAALERDWRRAGAETEALARAMREDAYANPGMAEASEALARALQAMERGELAEARRAASAGRTEEAARGHERLEERVRRAAEILHAGREMQAMQDFWSEAHRLDQAGAELKSGLEELARGGKPPTAEEKRRLAESLQELQRRMDELSKAIDALPRAEAGSAAEARRKIYRVPLQAAQRTADALSRAMAAGDYAQAARLAERLAQQLSQVHEAVAQAARSYSGEDDSAERLREATRLWEDVVEQQSRSLGMTQRLEEERIKGELEEQRSLLKELAREQAGVVDDAASPGAAAPPEALARMREALKEFEAARVERAPEALAAAAVLCRQAAAAQGGESPSARRLKDLAGREERILERLRRGARPPAPTESQLSDMMAARAVQGQTGRKTTELQERMDALSRELGTLPGEVLDSLRKARAEQQGAERALGRSDAASARGSQQRALEHLDQGRRSLSEALQRQESIQRGSVGPFQRPRGVARPMGRGGRGGADTGFVPLPGAEDYQPPREIRREIERSLRERRPRAFDEAVDEYLRRMSQ